MLNVNPPGFLHLGRCAIQKNNAFSTCKSMGTFYPPLTQEDCALGKAALHVEFSLGMTRNVVKYACRLRADDAARYALNYYTNVSVPEMIAYLHGQAVNKPLTDILTTPRFTLSEILSKLGLEDGALADPLSPQASEMWYRKPILPPWMGEPCVSPLLSGCVGDDEHALASFVHIYCYLKAVRCTMLRELPHDEPTLAYWHMAGNYVDVALLTNEDYTPEKQRVFYMILLVIQECCYFRAVDRESAPQYPYCMGYPWRDLEAALHGDSLGRTYRSSCPASGLEPNIVGVPFRSVYLTALDKERDPFYCLQDAAMYNAISSDEWRVTLDQCAATDYSVYRTHVDDRKWSAEEIEFIPSGLYELELYFTLCSVPFMPKLMRKLAKPELVWLPDPMRKLEPRTGAIFPKMVNAPPRTIPFMLRLDFEAVFISAVYALLSRTRDIYTSKEVPRQPYVAGVVKHSVEVITKIRFQNSLHFVQHATALAAHLRLSTKIKHLKRIVTIAFIPGLGSSMQRLAAFLPFKPHFYYRKQERFDCVCPSDRFEPALRHEQLTDSYKSCFGTRCETPRLKDGEQYASLATREMEHLWEIRVHVAHWDDEQISCKKAKKNILPLLSGSVTDDYFAFCSYQNAYAYLAKVFAVYAEHRHEPQIALLLESVAELLLEIYQRCEVERREYTLCRARALYAELLKLNERIKAKHLGNLRPIYGFPWNKNGSWTAATRPGPFVSSRTTLVAMEHKSLWERARKKNVGAYVMANLYAMRQKANFPFYQAADELDYQVYCALNNKNPGGLSNINKHRSALEDFLNFSHKKVGLYPRCYALGDLCKKDAALRAAEDFVDAQEQPWLFTRELHKVPDEPKVCDTADGWMEVKDAQAFNAYIYDRATVPVEFEAVNSHARFHTINHVTVPERTVK